MNATTFRPYRSPEDSETQYRLWLRATEGLPFAWKSNLTNVRALSKHAPEFPGSRLFAERQGRVVGYIGTHAPFPWEGLGTAVPFGFPWTFPHDEGLERELYDRMLQATPGVYAGTAIDVYIQRFRRSWARQHEFLAGRGWREAWRHPILARPIRPHAPAPSARPLIDAMIDDVVALAGADPAAPVPAPSADNLRRRFDLGWQERTASWMISGAGAFALEVREPWAGVKMFYADRHALDAVLSALDAKAAELGAREVYFTLGDGLEARRAQLEARGFRHADDDVYVRMDSPGQRAG